MRRVLLVVGAALLAMIPGFAGAAPFGYPDTARGTVSDSSFGTTVADPYRWMEDVDSPQTTTWVKAEGDLTRAYLDAIPQRGAIRDDYRKLLNYEKLGAPFRVFPAHSFKFAAALQHAQAGSAPVLLRVESKAGHGAGRPTEKIIDDVADRFAFLVKNLNFTPSL